MKTGGRKYSPKTGGFRPKREGWNLCSLFQGLNFSHNIPQVISSTFRKVVFTEQQNKSHQHRNIKAFASLNPCPRLIDVLN